MKKIGMSVILGCTMLFLTACHKGGETRREDGSIYYCIHGHEYIKAFRALAPIFGDDGKPIKCTVGKGRFSAHKE